MKITPSSPSSISSRMFDIISKNKIVVVALAIVAALVYFMQKRRYKIFKTNFNEIDFEKKDRVYDLSEAYEKILRDLWKQEDSITEEKELETLVRDVGQNPEQGEFIRKIQDLSNQFPKENRSQARTLMYLFSNQISFSPLAISILKALQDRNEDLLFGSNSHLAERRVGVENLEDRVLVSRCQTGFGYRTSCDDPTPSYYTLMTQAQIRKTTCEWRIRAFLVPQNLPIGENLVFEKDLAPLNWEEKSVDSSAIMI